MNHFKATIINIIKGGKNNAFKTKKENNDTNLKLKN